MRDQVEPLQDIHVNVIQVTPYVINIADMESKKFKQAKKRVLINSVSLDLILKVQQAQVLSKQVVDAAKFRQKTQTVGNLSAIQAQVSLDDLYVVQQLANKVTEDFVEIGKMWADYAEKHTETKQEKEIKI